MAKILIAGSDAFFSEMYGAKLSGAGHDVDFAQDGEEALNKITEQLFDLLLLDILMSKRGGIEVLREVRKDFSKPYVAIPVIILSPAGLSDEIELSMAHGANDYIVKNYHAPHEILHKIKIALTNF